MTVDNIKEILEQHRRWLHNEGGCEADLTRADLTGADLTGAYLRWAGLREANLTGANLREANLTRADLRGADLTGANLTGANLREANLTRADLRGADLQWANLTGANLTGADLQRATLQWADLTRADLTRADLRGADLQWANLTGADLREADLTGADLPRFQICPREGAFIAYKALANSAVAKLRIPEGAARTTSLVGRKCRAEFVEVLEIIGKDGNPVPQAVGRYDSNLIYVTGQTVHPDRYDPDVRLECTHGIHFFMTREEAREY